MPTVADITVLNIDENPYEVKDLSEEVRSLVELYNEWNQKEAEVRDELTRFQAAKETLSRQIITKVREDLAAQEAAANDASTEDSAEVVTEEVVEAPAAAATA